MMKMEKITTYTLLFVLGLFLTSCVDIDNDGDCGNDYGNILDYIEENDIEGFNTTGTGLIYKVTKTGNNTFPRLTDTVNVSYRGYFPNETVFDQSTSGISFPLNVVIEGWREGIQFFSEGGEGQLFIPSDLAYGANCVRTIPRNSDLIFDITVNEVIK
jgi:FKBP-type peptidyl-prolyl cis-trans isomerase